MCHQKTGCGCNYESMCPMLLGHATVSFVGRNTYKYFQLTDTKNFTLTIIFPLVIFVLVLLISKFCEKKFRIFSKFDFPEE